MPRYAIDLTLLVTAHVEAASPDGARAAFARDFGEGEPEFLEFAHELPPLLGVASTIATAVTSVGAVADSFQQVGV